MHFALETSPALTAIGCPAEQASGAGSVNAALERSPVLRAV